MFRCCQPKTLSPFCKAVVIFLALAGAMSVVFLCKKKLGCVAKKVRKLGCDCAESVCGEQNCPGEDDD